MVDSKNRSVADDREWGTAVRAQARRDSPSGPPRTAFENFPQRKIRFGLAQPSTHRWGDAIQECNRQCTPLHHEFGPRGVRLSSELRIAQIQHPEIIKQPTVSVLG